MLRRNIMVAALSRVGILVLIGLGGQSALFGNKESADSSSDDAIRALFHSKQREFSTLVEWIKEDRVLNTLGLDVRRPYYRFDPPTGSFVPEGEISSDRWESYRKLLKTMGITMPVNIWRAGGVIRYPLFAAGRAGGVSTYKGIA